MNIIPLHSYTHVFVVMNNSSPKPNLDCLAMHSYIEGFDIIFSSTGKDLCITPTVDYNIISRWIFFNFHA